MRANVEPGARRWPGLRLNLERRQALEGYICLAPWALGFLLWIAGPMVASLYLSLTEYDLFHPPTFTGLANYRRALFEDSLFWGSLGRTFYFAAIVVPLGTIAIVAGGLTAQSDAAVDQSLSDVLLPAAPDAGGGGCLALGLGLAAGVWPRQLPAQLDRHPGTGLVRQQGVGHPVDHADLAVDRYRRQPDVDLPGRAFSPCLRN